MFWFVRLVIAAVLITLLLLGLGYLLPAELRATKTTLIDAKPERVYEIVTDVEGQRQWRSEVRALKVESNGDLKQWVEDHGGGLSVHVRETLKKPIESYAVEFEMPNGLRGTWNGTFEPSSEERTKLTLTQTIVVENLLRRVVAYVVLNQDTLTDTYLGDLNRFAAKQDFGEVKHAPNIPILPP
jgi:uncharacterized protein YndB with AHSA1/START domain